MAKQTTKETKANDKIKLRRLDAVGGFLEVDSLAEAHRILKVEQESGFKNYELVDGEADPGDNTGEVESTEK